MTKLLGPPIVIGRMFEKMKEVQKNLWLFSRVLRNSTPRYVGRLVGRSPIYFFGVFELFELTAPAQML